MALDIEGRSIVLARNGYAGLGVQEVSGGKLRPKEFVELEMVDAIELSTDDLDEVDYVLSVQFWESYVLKIQEPQDATWEERPWIRLWPKNNPPPDDGSVIPLAQITLDGNGKVVTIEAGARRVAGPAGSLTLHRPVSDANALSVGQAAAAELRGGAERWAGGADAPGGQHGVGDAAVGGW